MLIFLKKKDRAFKFFAWGVAAGAARRNWSYALAGVDWGDAEFWGEGDGNAAGVECGVFKIRIG